MDAEDLKSAGLKVTLPRLKILEVLESSPSHHLSAEDIYRVLIEQNEEVGVQQFIEYCLSLRNQALFKS